MNSSAKSAVVATKRALDHTMIVSTMPLSFNPISRHPILVPGTPNPSQSARARERKEERAQDSPLKSPKHDRGLHLLTIPPYDPASVIHNVVVHITDIDIVGLVVENGQRDETREPEQHRQGV